MRIPHVQSRVIETISFSAVLSSSHRTVFSHIALTTSIYICAPLNIRAGTRSVRTEEEVIQLWLAPSSRALMEV